MTIGGSVLNSSAVIDFLAAVDARTGAGLWARQFNDGGGQLVAVAANPNLNRIAVCGYTDRASTDLAPGATYGGGSRDLVIGAFGSGGSLTWSKQAGGANEEECDAIAIDDNGDVLAAGKFDGALTFTGAALPGPNLSTRRWLWVARFDGSTGTALSQASFGGLGQITPNGLAVDGSGRLFIAGSFTAGVPFGTTMLTSAGGQDAFVAKLDSGLAPLWAVRLGGSGGDAANRVAVDSSGDATVVGLFFKTTTGAAALTASGTTAADAFVLKLGGATGQTQFAAAYGDANPQTADRIAINRQGAGAVKDLPVFGGSFSGTIDFGVPAGALTIPTTDMQAFLVYASFAP
jgi:hypothetical protein